MSRLLIAASATLIVGAVASADVILIQGDSAESTEGIGSFSGSLLWDYDALLGGTLTVSLTNTNDLSTGGFITAFAFNIDSVDPSRSASLLSASNSNFGLITNVDAMPFGMGFDAGASTGGMFQGGGSPNGGIGVGQTALFVFSIAASDLGSLSASSFVSGTMAHNFVVRFRGFADGGSDKVPAGVVENPIPAPGVLALLGLAGLAARRRRGR